MPDSHKDFELGRLNLDIPIFQKVYELYKLLYQYVASFPKKDRYTLGQRVENSLLDFMESVILASQLSKTEKLPILQKASIKLDVLKVFIRLCKDLKVLDNKKYLILESQVQEIGRMLGGWIKAST
jgi:four helix bundle protein